MFIVSYHIIVLQYIIASFYSALLYYITLYIILYVYTACIYVYNIYLQISLEVSLAGLSYWDTLGPSSWGRNQKLLPLDSMREWSPVKLGLSWTLAWPSPSTSVIHWSGDHGVFRKKLFQFGVIWFLALEGLFTHGFGQISLLSCCPECWDLMWMGFDVFGSKKLPALETQPIVLWGPRYKAMNVTIQFLIEVSSACAFVT